jgi:hypothetical protein
MNVGALTSVKAFTIHHAPVIHRCSGTTAHTTTTTTTTTTSTDDSDGGGIRLVGRSVGLSARWFSSIE